MKHIFIVVLLFLVSLTAIAHPSKRRTEQAQESNVSANSGLSVRAQLSYPTALQMDENVVWRRDIYRELDLTDMHNAALYYPEEPMNDQQNLFTYLFKLMLGGKIKCYEYRLDGNEVFNDSARIKPLDFLDNYGIYYERNGKQLHIDNSDIPSRDVTAYYIKESAYYDQTSATFHKKVVALCPIIRRMDDFGDAGTNYPLFWVKYDDVAPFLANQTVMTSDLNNAATMSADDYFSTNQYRGTIYKTTNMLGKTLAQVVGDDAEKLTEEQKRIEAEITAFEDGIYNTKPVTNPNAEGTETNASETKSEKKSSSSQRSTKTKTEKVKTTKSSSSSAGSTRVSARRERH